MVQTSSNIFEASTTPQRNRREKQKPATFSLSVEPSFTSQGEVIPSKPSMFFQTQTPTHHLSRETLPLQLCAIVFIFCPSPQFVERLWDLKHKNVHTIAVGAVYFAKILLDKRTSSFQVSVRTHCTISSQHLVSCELPQFVFETRNWPTYIQLEWHSTKISRATAIKLGNKLKGLPASRGVQGRGQLEVCVGWLY